MRQLASVVTVDKVWNLEGYDKSKNLETSFKIKNLEYQEKGLGTIHQLAGVENGK
jgi:hypothetical protein